MAAVSITMRFSLFSFVLHLTLLMSSVCPARGQETQSTTAISGPSASGTAVAMSSQMAWWEKEWDVVVVGSGPGGIIAASKCAAHPANLSVLLLEAGGPSYAIVGNTDHPAWLNGANISRVDCPGLYNSIFDSSVSSKQSLLCTGAVNAFGGCTVGGSTAINAGLYFAPPDSDWDSWGIDAWSSKNIHPSAVALQSIVGSGEIVTSSDGELYLQSSYNAMSKWLAAANYTEVDVNSQANYNSKTKVFGHTQFDYSGGQRGGPVTTYLQQFLARGERTALAQFSNVTRIIRNGSTASGVQVTQCNPGVSCQQYNISVSAKLGQVVLCAGALSTPRLLYFSGIGPNDMLTRLDNSAQLPIPRNDWIVNENVGSGLYDNPNTFIMLQSPDVQSYAFGYNGTGIGVVPGDLVAYRDHRAGPYTSPGQTGVFWDTVTRSDGRKVGMQGTVTSYGYADYQCPGCFTLNIYGTSGLQSRGRVELDNNWIPTPSNDTLYQSNTTDADDIASYIHQLLPTLSRANLTSLNIPQNATLDQIRNYITTTSPYARGLTNHWGGSTRMSNSCDTGAVTPNAKVCGMDNLYIVDGGIIPSLFTVNPQYGIMVASEHASDSILADRGDCCGCLGQSTATCPVSAAVSSSTATASPKPTVSSLASTIRLHTSRFILTSCLAFLTLSFIVGR